MSQIDESLLFRLMKEIHDLRDEVHSLKDRNEIKPALPEYKPCLRYGNDIPSQPPSLKNDYLLITCTFDPKKSVNLDEIGQNLLLKRSLDELPRKLTALNQELDQIIQKNENLSIGEEEFKKVY